MPYFPQLQYGAMAQYPLSKQRRARTVLSRAPGGSILRYGDPDARMVSWELRFAGLAQEEWAAIEGLFLASEGRLRNFVFLDPTDNLLADSEDLASVAWVKDPLLGLAAAAVDPFGGQGATEVTNAAQTAQSFSQTLAAPAGYQYCFSLYARSAQPASLTLRMEAPDGTESAVLGTSSEWKRTSFSARPGTAGDGVVFRVELNAGAVVEVAGLQVDAQAEASAYRKTAETGGLYAQARFADDVLRKTATGPGRFAALVRIESKAN